MTEEVDSRILGLDPSDTNKANDLNSFILGDTDDWSLDQIEVNTNISSLLPFPEEGKGIQIAHRDWVSVDELEKLLWPEPTELQLVQGDSMGIHTEIQGQNLRSLISGGTAWDQHSWGQEMKRKVQKIVKTT